MPYSKQHKAQTKTRILTSARNLFAQRGFDEVTVNQVMEDCKLTRGGFYAHFTSKSDLYNQALHFAASKTEIAKQKPEGMSEQQWVENLLEFYFSIEHVKGVEPCPLAFLVNDIVNKDKRTKATYQAIYENVNLLIHQFANIYNKPVEHYYAITSMMIGAVAVCRTIENEQVAIKILNSAKHQALELLLSP